MIYLRDLLMHFISMRYDKNKEYDQKLGTFGDFDKYRWDKWGKDGI